MSAHEQTEKDRATSAAIDEAIRGGTLGRRGASAAGLFGTAAAGDEPPPTTSFDGGARTAVRQPPGGAEIDEQIREIFNNKPRFGSFGD